MTVTLTGTSDNPDYLSCFKGLDGSGRSPRSMQTIGTFRTWLREEGYSARTREQYLTYARRARIELGPLHRVTPEALRVWWATLPPTASSRNAARNALTAYYRHRGRPTGHPAATLPCIPDRDHLPRPVPVEVYERFIDAATDLGGPRQILGYLLAYTGCRIGEARTARRSAFDLTGLTWRIQGKGSGKRGPKERVVAVHPTLAAVVARSPEPDWLFPSPNLTGPVHRTTISLLFREVADHAGLVVTAHQLRHTVATLGLERTRDIRAVQELLGHASLATTQRYTQVTGTRVREVVGALGPL